MKRYAKKADLGALLDNGDGTFTVTATNWDHVTNSTPPWGWIITCDGSGNILSQRNHYLTSTGLAARSSAGDIYLSDAYSSELTRVDGNSGEEFWHKAFRPTANVYPREEATAIEAVPEGGVVLAAGSGTNPYSAVLVRINANGEVLWAKNYSSDSFSDSTPGWPQVSATYDGGFLLVADTSKSTPTLSRPDTALLRLDSFGNVLWQERLVSADYPAMSPAIIRNVGENNDGTILVWGVTGYLADHPGLSNVSFIAELDQSGMPLWNEVFSFGDEVVVNAWKAEDGIRFARPGTNESVTPNRAGPGLWKVGISGFAPDGCNIFPLVLLSQPTTYEYQSIPQFVTEGPLSGGGSTNVRPDKLSGIKDVVICGDPVITGVTQLTSPFRLKLTGWNFDVFSRVFIDGLESPQTTYKGQDTEGHSKLVISGDGLKAMVPKGQNVCLTAVNFDGTASECFIYRR